MFNKLPQVGELLGDRVEDTANERIMAIVGGFTTIKGNNPPDTQHNTSYLSLVFFEISLRMSFYV